MDKELTEVIGENRILYRLAENGCYYPALRLPEGTRYNIGKYGLMLLCQDLVQTKMRYLIS